MNEILNLFGITQNDGRMININNDELTQFIDELNKDEDGSKTENRFVIMIRLS